MDNVCYIAVDSTGRDVAGITEEDLFPCGGDGGERQSAADEKGNGGLGVELGQGFRVAVAPERVCVFLIDELVDGVFAVSDDVGGHTLACCHELATDDHHAIVAAREHLLDDDAAGVRLDVVEGENRVLWTRHVEGDPVSVTTVERFDDDGES